VIDIVERPENISEYWFHKYYRVLVIELDGSEKIVNVDVYRKGWIFDNYKETCLSNGKYCLLNYVIEDVERLKTLLGELCTKVKKIGIMGVKVGEKVETINVKYFVIGDLRYDEIKELFYKSWELIKSNLPQESSLP